MSIFPKKAEVYLTLWNGFKFLGSIGQSCGRCLRIWAVKWVQVFGGNWIRSSGIDLRIWPLLGRRKLEISNFGLGPMLLSISCRFGINMCVHYCMCSRAQAQIQGPEADQPDLDPESWVLCSGPQKLSIYCTFGPFKGPKCPGTGLRLKKWSFWLIWSKVPISCQVFG